MASIKISELRPVGSELFVDSESFLNELNEQEFSTTIGGGGTVNSVLTQNTESIGTSIETASIITESIVTQSVTY